MHGARQAPRSMIRLHQYHPGVTVKQTSHVALSVLQASNEALAAEKTRMDVLLARQYNLISCMAGQQDMGNSGRGTTLEEKTLGKRSGRVPTLDVGKHGAVAHGVYECDSCIMLRMGLCDEE